MFESGLTAGTALSLGSLQSLHSPHLYPLLYLPKWQKPQRSLPFSRFLADTENVQLRASTWPTRYSHYNARAPGKSSVPPPLHPLLTD